eukprot:Phypoly_transcript_00066.p1 GENE.Phypoly_transcript_00066~~Phypoly_transcript_00066.p1  ORF type:complete len:2446 (-),score=572.43 Phypoly_transcript_00066:272-7609(-)
MKIKPPKPKRPKKEFIITEPTNFRHLIGVDANFDWNVENPEHIFKMGDKLGEGSFGVVHRVNYSGYTLAIKLVEVDEGQTESIANEIKILKDCTHPNVVSYFGAFKTSTKLYILMDFCELGSVRDVIELAERTLSESEIAAICCGALAGLSYLHTRNKPIVHKDIKAANMLLTDKGEIKLADFGVSQQLHSTLSLGCVEGTPHWMAPEIGDASRFNGKADIWSLGITAIEMAQGQPPYSDMHPRRAMHMIKQKPPPRLENPKKWSNDFNDFVAKCLVKDFTLRPSAAELLEHPFILGVKHGALKELCSLILQKKHKEFKKREKEKKKSPLSFLTGSFMSSKGGSKGSKGSNPTMLVKDSGSNTGTAENYDTMLFNDTMSEEDYSTVRRSEDGSVRDDSRFSSVSSSYSSAPRSRHHSARDPLDLDHLGTQRRAPDPLDLDAPSPRKRRFDTGGDSTMVEAGVQTDFPEVSALIRRVKEKNKKRRIGEGPSRATSPSPMHGSIRGLNAMETDSEGTSTDESDSGIPSTWSDTDIHSLMIRGKKSPPQLDPRPEKELPYDTVLEEMKMQLRQLQEVEMATPESQQQQIERLLSLMQQLPQTPPWFQALLTNKPRRPALTLKPDARQNNPAQNKPPLDLENRLRNSIGARNSLGSDTYGKVPDRTSIGSDTSARITDTLKSETAHNPSPRKAFGMGMSAVTASLGAAFANVAPKAPPSGEPGSHDNKAPGASSATPPMSIRPLIPMPFLRKEPPRVSIPDADLNAQHFPKSTTPPSLSPKAQDVLDALAKGGLPNASSMLNLGAFGTNRTPIPTRDFQHSLSSSAISRETASLISAPLARTTSTILPPMLNPAFNGAGMLFAGAFPGMRASASPVSPRASASPLSPRGFPQSPASISTTSSGPNFPIRSPPTSPSSISAPSAPFFPIVEELDGLDDVVPETLLAQALPLTQATPPVEIQISAAPSLVVSPAPSSAPSSASISAYSSTSSSAPSSASSSSSSSASSSTLSFAPSSSYTPSFAPFFATEELDGLDDVVPQTALTPVQSLPPAQPLPSAEVTKVAPSTPAKPLSSSPAKPENVNSNGAKPAPRTGPLVSPLLLNTGIMGGINMARTIPFVPGLKLPQTSANNTQKQTTAPLSENDAAAKKQKTEETTETSQSASKTEGATSTQSAPNAAPTQKDAASDKVKSAADTPSVGVAKNSHNPEIANGAKSPRVAEVANAAKSPRNIEIATGAMSPRNAIAMAAARSFNASAGNAAKPSSFVSSLAHIASAIDKATPQQKPIAPRSNTPKPLSSTSTPSHESRADTPAPSATSSAVSASKSASPAPVVTSPAAGSKIKSMANIFAAKAEQNAAPIRARTSSSPSPVKPNPASSSTSVRSPTGGLGSKSTTGTPTTTPLKKDSDPKVTAARSDKMDESKTESTTVPLANNVVKPAAASPAQPTAPTRATSPSPSQTTQAPAPTRATSPAPQSQPNKTQPPQPAAKPSGSPTTSTRLSSASSTGVPTRSPTSATATTTTPAANNPPTNKTPANTPATNTPPTNTPPTNTPVTNAPSTLKPIPSATHTTSKPPANTPSAKTLASATPTKTPTDKPKPTPLTTLENDIIPPLMLSPPATPTPPSPQISPAVPASPLLPLSPLVPTTKMVAAAKATPANPETQVKPSIPATQTAPHTKPATRATPATPELQPSRATHASPATIESPPLKPAIRATPATPEPQSSPATSAPPATLEKPIPKPATPKPKVIPEEPILPAKKATPTNPENPPKPASPTTPSSLMVKLIPAAQSTPATTEPLPRPSNPAAPATREIQLTRATQANPATTEPCLTPTHASTPANPDFRAVRAIPATTEPPPPSPARSTPPATPDFRATRAIPAEPEAEITTAIPATTTPPEAPPAQELSAPEITLTLPEKIPELSLEPTQIGASTDLALPPGVDTPMPKRAAALKKAAGRGQKQRRPRSPFVRKKKESDGIHRSELGGGSDDEWEDDPELPYEEAFDVLIEDDEIIAYLPKIDEPTTHHSSHSTTSSTSEAPSTSETSAPSTTSETSAPSATSEPSTTATTPAEDATASTSAPTSADPTSTPSSTEIPEIRVPPAQQEISEPEKTVTHIPTLTLAPPSRIQRTSSSSDLLPSAAKKPSDATTIHATPRPSIQRTSSSSDIEKPSFLKRFPPTNDVSPDSSEKPFPLKRFPLTIDTSDLDKPSPRRFSPTDSPLSSSRPPLQRTPSSSDIEKPALKRFQTAGDLLSPEPEKPFSLKRVQSLPNDTPQPATLQPPSRPTLQRTPSNSDLDKSMPPKKVASDTPTPGPLSLAAKWEQKVKQSKEKEQPPPPSSQSRNNPLSPSYIPALGETKQQPREQVIISRMPDKPVNSTFSPPNFAVPMTKTTKSTGAAPAQTPRGAARAAEKAAASVISPRPHASTSPIVAELTTTHNALASRFNPQPSTAQARQ